MHNLPLAQANFVDLLGIGPLPIGERRAIVEIATELIETRVMNRVLAGLDAEKKTELQNALDAKNATLVVNLFAKNSIDVVAVIQEEVERVKGELVEIAKVEE